MLQVKVGRRKLKNLLIFPESQVRYGLVFLAMATFTHVALTLIVLRLYSAWETSEGELPVNAPVWILLVGLFLLYFLLQAFAFVLGLFMSHKIFGPLVPIRKFVDDLKNDQPTTPIVLRKNDEPMLIELAQDLNELGQKFSKK
jgi:hypothetical protein